MPRNTRPEKKPCVNCKQKKQVVAEEAKPVFNITLDSEMQRLWRHVTVGTTTCVSMIEQYQDADMEHMPVDQIAELRDRLTSVLEKA